MPTLSQITQSIMQDPDNQSFTSQGIKPLLSFQYKRLSWALIPGACPTILMQAVVGAAKSGSMPCDVKD